MISVMALVLVIGIGFLVREVTAKSDTYPKMAPFDQYLMERYRRRRNIERLILWLHNILRFLPRYERYAENLP
jgi:hypothetical protein